jgi:hypothetical protein
MNCSNCQPTKIRNSRVRDSSLKDAGSLVKNGRRRGKQNYQCKECHKGLALRRGRQFITKHSAVGYSLSIKEI